VEHRTNLKPETSSLTELLNNPLEYARVVSGLRLRRYQEAVMCAVAESVRTRRGLSFVVMFPRQSGKNELQAQLEAYLLTLLSQCGGEMVKVSPTWKPQSLNAMRRLQRVLEGNLFTRGRWQKESGYIYRLGAARLTFLSGGPEAHIVGATAADLLEVDEAQDVQITKYDKEIAPMAASTNATRVFWGTAWTADTLLGRELRAAEEAQAQDGLRRVFRLTADEVGAEVPAYAAFVAEQVGKLGRSHPFIRTQFYSEELDAGGGMFPPARRALMQGSHAALEAPRPGGCYALLLDVAGQDESADADHDATALTVIEADLSDWAALCAPVYRVVHRRLWQGVRHTLLQGQIRALAEHWRARWLVVDATGVGAGLAAFLDRALCRPCRQRRAGHAYGGGRAVDALAGAQTAALAAARRRRHGY